LVHEGSLKTWATKIFDLSVRIFVSCLKIYWTSLKFTTPLYIYIGCSRRNVPNFVRLFLMLKYTDITHKTYIQSWTVTETMVREMCGLLAVPRTVPAQLTRYPYTAHVRPWEFHCYQRCDCVMNG
jgi:hypothetical protein